MLVLCNFGTLPDADISGIAIKVKKIKIKIYDLKGTVFLSDCFDKRYGKGKKMAPR